MVGVTKDYVYKIAMAQIGNNAVLDNNQGEKTAITQFLDAIEKEEIRSLLEAEDWRFAMKEVQLTKSNDPGSFGFAYKYSIPTDCIGINFSFYQNNNCMYSDKNATTRTAYNAIVPIAYVVAGRFVHTDMDTLNKMTYKALILDYPEMTLAFAGCLARKMATVLAKKFNPSLYTVCVNEYQMALANAMHSDSKNSEGYVYYGDKLRKDWW